MSPFDRFFKVMTHPAVIILYFTLIVISFLYFDKEVAVYFYHVDVKTHYPFFKWITYLGTGALYFTTFFILAVFFRYAIVNSTYEKRALFLFSCVFIPSILCIVLKMIVGRARPSMWLNHHIYGIYGFQKNAAFWSLPSGHTTTIMGAAFGLGIVFPRYFYVFLAVGAAVALSRILLLNHYISDVMVAFYLTLLEVGLMLYIMRRRSWLAPAWKDTV